MENMQRPPSVVKRLGASHLGTNCEIWKSKSIYWYTVSIYHTYPQQVVPERRGDVLWYRRGVHTAILEEEAAAGSHQLGAHQLILELLSVQTLYLLKPCKWAAERYTAITTTSWTTHTNASNALFFTRTKKTYWQGRDRGHARPRQTGRGPQIPNWNFGGKYEKIYGTNVLGERRTRAAFKFGVWSGWRLVNNSSKRTWWTAAGVYEMWNLLESSPSQLKLCFGRLQPKSGYRVC